MGWPGAVLSSFALTLTLTLALTLALALALALAFALAPAPPFPLPRLYPRPHFICQAAIIRIGLKETIKFAKMFYAGVLVRHRPEPHSSNPPPCLGRPAHPYPGLHRHLHSLT